MSERPMPESEMAKLEVPDRCPTCGSDDPKVLRFPCNAPNGPGGWPQYPDRTFHQSDTESEEGT